MHESLAGQWICAAWLGTPVFRETSSATEVIPCVPESWAPTCMNLLSITVTWSALNYCTSATSVSTLLHFSSHTLRPLGRPQITHHFSTIILWHLPLLFLSGVSITFGHQLEKIWCVQHRRAQTCGIALNLSGEKVLLEGRTGPNQAYFSCLQSPWRYLAGEGLRGELSLSNMNVSVLFLLFSGKKRGGGW